MAKTDELEAAPKNDEAKADAKVGAALKTLILDVRVLLVAVVALFGGGWVALAQVDNRASSVAEGKLRSYETRLTAVEERQAADASITNHRLDELQNEVREGAAETRALRKDLRELFPRLRDGGDK